MRADVEVFGALRKLAEDWKQASARSRENDGTFGEACAARDRCAKELLDLVFRLEST